MAIECDMTVSELVRFIVTTKRVELVTVPVSSNEKPKTAVGEKDLAATVVE
jgi:hypothetical protein